MRLLLLGVVALLLTGCGSQAENVRTVLDEMLVNGQVTQTQYDALLEALTAGDWTGLLQMLGAIGVSIAGALGYVRFNRGSVYSRKGEAPAGGK